MNEESEKSGVGYDWCVDIEGKVVKIENAISGKHGYFCGDCDCEMIAKKGIENAHHFAHDALDVVHYGHCTHATETYLHKVAKEILQRTKIIRVPSVKKYPPVGMEGMPNQLSEAKFIMAHTVENEMTFYENINGEVGWGRKIDFEQDTSKHFLIRPDVAFFDVNNKPILLIEIVVTHKITDDKLFKIKQLGIDTVQVNIPRWNDDEGVEEILSTTNRTKWVFNNEQESTKYVPSSNRTAKKNEPLDEFERGILESGESFKCRSSQINNTIRAFRKFMEGNIYREEIAKIEGETAIIEADTVEHRERLQRLQEGHQERLELEFGKEAERIESETAMVEAETARIEAEASEYRAGLQRLQKEYEEQIELEFGEEAQGIESIRQLLNTRDQELCKRRRRMDEDKSNVEKRYTDKRDKIYLAQREYRASCQDEIDRLVREFGETGDHPDTIEESLARIRRMEIEYGDRHRVKIVGIKSEQNDETANIKSIERRRETLRSIYESIEESIRRENIELENIIRERIDGEIELATQSIENRDYRTKSRIAEDLQGIIHAAGFFGTFKVQKQSNERLRTAKKLLDSGSYKNWV